MDSKDRIRKGHAAEQLLNNQIFKDAFEGVKHLIVKELEEQMLDGSPEGERHTLELVRRLQTLKGVKRAVVAHVNSGQLAAHQED